MGFSWLESCRWLECGRVQSARPEHPAAQATRDAVVAAENTAKTAERTTLAVTGELHWHFETHSPWESKANLTGKISYDVSSLMSRTRTNRGLKTARSMSAKISLTPTMREIEVFCSVLHVTCITTPFRIICGRVANEGGHEAN